jgi:hypothetical protein
MYVEEHHGASLVAVAILLPRCLLIPITAMLKISEVMSIYWHVTSTTSASCVVCAGADV